MKKGLVMEGGAMRGIFTCGVIDVFMENDIDFDGAAGISAGAVFGLNIKSRQIGRGVRYNKKYCNDPRYCSFRSLLLTGDIYNVDFCYKELPEKLDYFDSETFEKNPLKFYIGATDVNTGRAVFHRCRNGFGEDMKWLQASASMPLVSKIVKAGGRELLDGGVTCPVPYHFMKSKGYGKNVVILTQPKGYRKEKPDMMTLSQIVYRDYPRLVRAISKRPEVYNRQMEEIDRDEKLGKIIVIRPPRDMGISRTERDPEELERVYQMGRREALAKLEEIRKYLGK